MADPITLAASGVGVLIGTAQSLINSGRAKRANRDLKRLFSQRKAFQTPQEVFDILNLTQFNASQGFSDETMSFLTNQSGAGLSAGLDAATTLGADPNQLSGMIDQYFSNLFRIGAESEQVKMKRANEFISAMQLVAGNKEAEWASRENIIKDQMAAATQRLTAAQTGIQSGMNLALNSAALGVGSTLYRDNTPPAVPPAGVDTSPYTATNPGTPRQIDVSTGERPQVPNRSSLFN